MISSLIRRAPLFPKYAVSSSRQSKALNYTRAMNPGPLVWIDCEMTGLDPKTDKIIEICCFVTDGKLALLEPNGYQSVIHCSQEKLESMSDWCKNTHGRSGLTRKVLESQKAAPQVETELLQYLKPLVKPKMGVLAGNSVHMDRIFLMNEFPKLTDFLHYRLVDVSSIKEIGYRHNPELMRQVPKKKLAHTAKEDILESIAELRWYMDNYLIPPKSTNS